MSSPFATHSSLFGIIRATQAAPSIHNTQPWSLWIRSDDRIELRASWRRHLTAVDPRARELTISCGAALFNLRMAIRMAGLEPAVWLVPDVRTDPALLASVEIVPGETRPPSPGERRLYEAIPRRHTNREPFSGRRIPGRVVAELERAAWQERAYLSLLHQDEVGPLLRAAADADSELTADRSYLAELRRWTGHADPGYGIPAEAFGPLPHGGLPGGRSGRRSAPPVRDLAPGWVADRPVARFERHPRLLVLATDGDQPLDWMRAGQALQRVLLTATDHGLAASFLSQPFEVYDRRHEPESRRPARLRHAHMIIRLGYGRRPVAGTPRAPYPDVVDCRVQPPLPVRVPALPHSFSSP